MRISKTAACKKQQDILEAVKEVTNMVLFKFKNIPELIIVDFVTAGIRKGLQDFMMAAIAE